MSGGEFIHGPRCEQVTRKAEELVMENLWLRDQLQKAQTALRHEKLRVAAMASGRPISTNWRDAIFAEALPGGDGSAKEEREYVTPEVIKVEGKKRGA